LRKTSIVVIPETDSANRDRGKQYLITEKSALEAEKWAARALFALGKSGIDIPEEAAQAGMAGIAIIGLKALLSMNFADAEPLLNEMMSCIEYIPNPSNPSVKRPLFDGDIEEVTTLLKLRSEVFNLHTGFSIADAISTSSSARTPGTAPQKPKTSQPSSSQSSRPGRHPSRS